MEHQKHEMHQHIPSVGGPGAAIDASSSWSRALTGHRPRRAWYWTAHLSSHVWRDIGLTLTPVEVEAVHVELIRHIE
jgi:hypothetical protein